MNESEIIAQAAEYLDVFTSKMEKMPDTANVKRLVAELYAIAASAGDAPAVQGEPVYWLVRNEFEGYMQFHDHPPRDCDISPYGLDEIIPLYTAPQPAEQRCEYCDGTGDVHSIDGEWRGTCSCPAALSGLPDSLPMEPYQTVDRGSPHYKAGWNACRRAMLAALEKLIAAHHEAHRKQGGGYRKAGNCR